MGEVSTRWVAGSEPTKRSNNSVTATWWGPVAALNSTG